MSNEANAYKAMQEANVAMCPHGGSVPDKDRDKHIALANGIMLANAVRYSLLQIAEAIKKAKGGD